MQILANLGYRWEKIKTTNLNKHDYTLGARWTHLEQMSSIWPRLWYQSGNVSGMLLTVGSGGGRSHGTCVHMWTAAHWDLLCMLYLIVILANRKREAHQQAMPGSQWLGKAHVDDLIGTCWRGALPLLKKSTNWINIESAEKISVCWKKHYYS